MVRYEGPGKRTYSRITPMTACAASLAGIDEESRSGMIAITCVSPGKMQVISGMYSRRKACRSGPDTLEELLAGRGTKMWRTLPSVQLHVRALVGLCMLGYE